MPADKEHRVGPEFDSDSGLCMTALCLLVYQKNRITEMILCGLIACAVSLKSTKNIQDTVGS